MATQVNKDSLISVAADKSGISKVKASEVLDAILGHVTDTLSQKGRVQLIGFGTFSTSDRKATTGRNPSTGEAIKIAAKTVAKFTPGKALKEKVNK